MDESAGKKRERAFLRFKLFGVSIVSTALLLLSLITTWAHIEEYDGLFWSSWNCRFRGMFFDGKFVSYPQAGYVILVVLCLLLACVVLSTLMCAILYDEKILGKRSLGSKETEYVLLTAIGLSSTALVMLSVVAPRMLLEIPHIWYNASNSTSYVYSTPGLSWFFIIGFIALQTILFFGMRRFYR